MMVECKGSAAVVIILRLHTKILSEDKSFKSFNNLQHIKVKEKEEFTNEFYRFMIPSPFPADN